MQETGLGISKGVTIGGKRIAVHLAIDPKEAINYIGELRSGQASTV